MLSLSPANGKVFSRVCPSMGGILGPRGGYVVHYMVQGVCSFHRTMHASQTMHTPETTHIPSEMHACPWNSHCSTDHTCPLITNGGQVGGTHPTGMLSCSFFILSTEGPVNIWTFCPVYTQFLTFHIDLFEILK